MPTTRRRMAAHIAPLTAAFAAAFTTTVAGCAAHHHVAVVTQPTSYAPAYYGQQVGNTFDCYYVDSPAEVTSLMAAGLCPANAVPTLMPLIWHETYASYYDSPGYYNTYIPVARRSTFVNVTVVNFNKQYGPQITAQSRNATYKSNTGAVVKGSALPSTGVTFGGGNARVAPTLGGGNRTSAPSVPRVATGGLGGGNARNNAPAPKITPPKVVAR